MTADGSFLMEEPPVYFKIKKRKGGNYEKEHNPGKALRQRIWCRGS